jgi:arylsulfate sulfotransferase
MPQDRTQQSTSRPSPLTRRTLLAGAGAAATALALAACDGDPSGVQTARTDELSASLSEYGGASGDAPVWQVGYDLEEDQEAPATYSATAQAARHAALEAKRTEQEWTATAPLLVLDPYGTTRTGLYLHFTDAAAGTLEFTVTADATAEYRRTAADHADGGGFTGLLVGLIPGARNRLTLTWTPEGGAPVRRELHIQPPGSTGTYPTQLASEVPDPAALSAGLFAITGITGPGNTTYLFDNAGVGRGELLSTDHPTHNLRVEGGRLVVTTGSRQISVIDPLGHAAPIIDTGDQIIHHDLEVVGDMVYALTSKEGNERVEDRVIRVDLASGDVVEVVDLQKLFPAYEALAHAREAGFAGGTDVTGKDWIHLNSVHVVDGIMYLSARETSTVIALGDALEPGSEPSVRWMIGVQGIWEGTGYEDLFLAPAGSPTGNAGQHTVTRLDDDSLPPGRYYLEMFNNNHWYLGTRDEEVWRDVGPETAHPGELDGVSHVLRYLIDEDAGTFSEDQRIDVAYSSVVSNVHRIGGDSLTNPMIVNSGKANVFTEHAADGRLLGTFRYDSSNMAYRVYKDAFAGFWFTAG